MSVPQAAAASTGPLCRDASVLPEEPHGLLLADGCRGGIATHPDSKPTDQQRRHSEQVGAGRKRVRSSGVTRLLPKLSPSWLTLEGPPAAPAKPETVPFGPRAPLSP